MDMLLSTGELVDTGQARSEFKINAGSRPVEILNRLDPVFWVFSN